MTGPRARLHAVVFFAIATTVFVAGSAVPATAAVAAAKKPAITCKQLTKSQIQPLVSDTVSSVKVTAGGFAGQQCVFSNSDAEAAIDVLVDKGSEAATEFNTEVKNFTRKVAVPGVSGKAYRDTGDFTIEALYGDKYCSVSTGSADTIPGVGAIEAANGGTSDIGDANDAVLARALGTICNRIYGSGNTKPSLDGLSTPVTTTGP
jgi:hypothetical protein